MDTVVESYKWNKIEQTKTVPKKIFKEHFGLLTSKLIFVSAVTHSCSFAWIGSLC